MTTTSNEVTERERAFEEWFGARPERQTTEYLALQYWVTEAWNAAWQARASLPQPSAEVVADYTTGRACSVCYGRGYGVDDKPCSFGCRPVATLPAAPEMQAAPCHCEACEPNEPFNSRMILCATCGNKRCPHATDHRNGCTNSNEPGQLGSSYGMVLKEGISVSSDTALQALVDQAQELDMGYGASTTPQKET